VEREVYTMEGSYRDKVATSIKNKSTSQAFLELADGLDKVINNVDEVKSGIETLTKYIISQLKKLDTTSDSNNIDTLITSFNQLVECFKVLDNKINNLNVNKTVQLDMRDINKLLDELHVTQNMIQDKHVYTDNELYAMHKNQSMSYSKISAITGINKSTIAKRIQKIKNKEEQ
jgi:hypothetical protein